jgi:uncharacterized membrane protein
MKHADIQKLHETGFITDEQRQKIIEHFQLKEDGGGKFLAIVSIIGAVLIALDILAAYCDLFGSKSRTGVMFLISGIFLIVFGVYLEKKRRTLMKQIKTQPAKGDQP